MATLSEDQFKRLLDTLAISQGSRGGSFAQCTARYDGTRDTQQVEEFLTVTTTYKRSEGLDDQKALEALPLLLIGLANTWWQGVKEKVRSWEEAVRLIREALAPKRPAYRVYMDLFAEKQHSKTPVDTFLCHKRALLAELPDDAHSEAQQLDLIFGLLHQRIRKRIRREEVQTFADLLTKTRIVEESQEEKENYAERKTSEDPKTRSRARCGYCRRFDHKTEDCRTKKRNCTTEISKPQETPVTIVKPEIHCYGCNKPEVIRSKYPNCNPSTQTLALSFCAVNPVGNLQMEERPPSSSR